MIRVLRNTIFWHSEHIDWELFPIHEFQSAATSACSNGHFIWRLQSQAGIPLEPTFMMAEFQ